jgi:hypothetical protein
VIVVYVDDLMITGSSSKDNSQFKRDVAVVPAPGATACWCRSGGPSGR